MEFITGEKFVGLADFVFTSPVIAKDDYYRLPSTFNVSQLKTKNIVYTHTMYVKELFEIIEDIDKEFVIISHNSDINIDASFKVPDNVIKWYTMNVNVVDPKIESIPIGLENDRWFPQLQKKEVMLQILRMPKFYKNLVYMNHNVKTNLSKRQSVYLLERNEWVTSVRGVNGVDFLGYIKNVYNHKFVICPEGNGLDTHRFWECLYMDTVPVVIKNINNWFYSDMPILYVNKWEELNEWMLNDMWDNIYRDGQWDKNKLTFEYWKNKILN